MCITFCNIINCKCTQNFPHTGDFVFFVKMQHCVFSQRKIFLMMFISGILFIFVFYMLYFCVCYKWLKIK